MKLAQQAQSFPQQPNGSVPVHAKGCSLGGIGYCGAEGKREFMVSYIRVSSITIIAIRFHTYFNQSGIVCMPIYMRTSPRPS